MMDSLLDELPDDVLLKIFSDLSAEDVRQNIALVNRRWYQLTKDPLLWEHLIQKACSTWNFITDSTHPDVVREVLQNLSTEDCSPITSRQIYIVCSALHREIREDLRSPVDDYNLMAMLKSTLLKVAPKRISNVLLSHRSYSPKFSMIGPGLNSDQFNLMPEIIQGRGILKMTGTFAGSHELPFSSGMTYELNTGATDSIHFDLIMLYVAYHSQRINTFREGEYLLGPPLYEPNPNDPSIKGVSENLKRHLTTQKGLIYTVDASMSDKLFHCALVEITLLAAVIKALRIPVLVLSIVRDVNNTRGRSAYEVSRLLQLPELLGDTVAWRVQDVICSGMWCFEEGLMWLHCQSRTPLKTV